MTGDPIQRMAKAGRTLRSRMDAVDAAVARAQGVKSTIGGAIGGTTDIADRYIALCEDYDRLIAAFEAWDDRRQAMMECAEMVEDDELRAVLYTAIADALRHGSVVKARCARRMRTDKQTFNRRYERAVDALEVKMREHHVQRD